MEGVPGYELRAPLGRGTFGEVWDATRLSDGASVALKVLRDGAGEEARLRFQREARVAGRIASAHVCRVLDARTEGPAPRFIAYERLFGETLDARLEREGDLGLGEALELGDHLLDALVAAHAAGVVHRDVKPANVFLEELAGGVRARLLDFGIAKAPGEEDTEAISTTGGATLGTLAFMAPEQAGAAASVDGRADLYGLGAVLFRALSGRTPFSASSPATMLALKLERDPPRLGEVTGVEWPSGVESLLAKMLAREPARRYPSAAEAWNALREVRARVRAVMGGAS